MRFALIPALLAATLLALSACGDEGEVREVEPGDDNSGTYTLDPGKYVLICNLKTDVDGQDTAHYAQGMYAAFTVTASE